MNKKNILILGLTVTYVAIATFVIAIVILHEPENEHLSQLYVASVDIDKNTYYEMPHQTDMFYEEALYESYEIENPTDTNYNGALGKEMLDEYPDYIMYDIYDIEEPIDEPDEPIEEPVVLSPPLDARRPMVALTFDDGPAEPTSRILDILEYHNAQATFFVIGRRLDRWRDTALRAFESGHEIANHTFSHQILTYPLTDEAIINEILTASAAIEALTGVPPAPMFRPPAGRRDDRLSRLSYELGYAMILWNLDPFDWRDRDANTIYFRIMSNVRDGSIIVLHDTHHTTAQAMERVVPRLIEMGFDLVTVSELLYHNHGKMPMPGQVYR